MRTDDEIFGDLEQAIEKFLAETGERGLLLDWVLVTHKLSPNPDGSNDASTGYTGAEHQTHYRTLGLLEYASTVVRTEIQHSMEGMD